MNHETGSFKTDQLHDGEWMHLVDFPILLHHFQHTLSSASSPGLGVYLVMNVMMRWQSRTGLL